MNNNSNIGTDPSNVETIDFLDVDVPSQSSKPNNDKNKKNNGTLKKVLLIILIFIIIGGIGYGIYYYLGIGTGNTIVKKSFTLKDLKIYQYDQLPEDINDYGDFSKIDVDKCKLNTDDVDLNKLGKYNYTVTCDKVKNTATITVIENVEQEEEEDSGIGDVLPVTINPVIITEGSQIKETDFVTSNEDYGVEITNLEKLNKLTSTVGGPYPVNLKITSLDDKIMNTVSVLYVTKENPKYLECSKSAMVYTQNDKIAFDQNNNMMNVNIRNYIFNYSQESILKKIELIEDGSITIESLSGYALIDNINYKIKIFSTLDSETLNKEYNGTFPTSYDEIKNYYINTKGFNC